MLKVKYANLTDIPEWARQLYTQQGSEWVLKTDAIEGAAEYLNPNLAANRDAFRTEKENVQARLTQTQNELAAVQAQLSRVTTPGAVVLSADQAKLWQRYEALGKPAELETMKAQHGEMSGQLAQFKLMSDLEDVAKQTGLNPEALKRELPLNFPGVKLVVREVDVNQNGKTVKQKQAYAQISQNVNGVNQLSEQPFLQYAKDQRMPDYVLNALTAQPNQGQQLQNNGQPIIAPATGWANSNLNSQPANGTPMIKPLVPTTGASNPQGSMGTSNGGFQINAQALLARANQERGVKLPENNGQPSNGGVA